MAYGYDDAQDYFDSIDQQYYHAGNAITCEYHPNEVVSNGRFDAPCGACEGEMADQAMEADMQAEADLEAADGDTNLALQIGAVRLMAPAISDAIDDYVAARKAAQEQADFERSMARGY